MVHEMTQLLFSWTFPLAFSISKSNVWKISATDSFCFADVSKNEAFHESASRLPSSELIIRSICKSVLLPTKTMGTLKKWKLINSQSKFQALIMLSVGYIINLVKMSLTLCHLVTSIFAIYHAKGKKFSLMLKITYFTFPVISNSLSYITWITSKDLDDVIE